MRRTVFNEDHEAFRETLRAFIEAEVVPVYDEWFAAGQAPGDFYYKLAELGVFGIRVDEEYGGAGIDSVQVRSRDVRGDRPRGRPVRRLPACTCCSACRTSRCSPPTSRRSASCLKFVSGEEYVGALAMTEPGTGSDLAGMKTTAKLSEDGTHYVLNGSKTFITGGVHADRVIVCARTSAPTAEDRRHGISLFAVDTKSEGYSIGRKLTSWA
ncbi:Acyl-[acyl-carrier-protein] dehydrogenase MbtN OS=Streptomyces alboniger OX=132473 GN=CP975_12460 PE=3 SV=1 [Streptomyces alboniger]